MCVFLRKIKSEKEREREGEGEEVRDKGPLQNGKQQLSCSVLKEKSRTFKLDQNVVRVRH